MFFLRTELSVANLQRQIDENTRKNEELSEKVESLEANEGLVKDENGNFNKITVSSIGSFVNLSELLVTPISFFVTPDKKLIYFKDKQIIVYDGTEHVLFDKTSSSNNLTSSNVYMDSDTILYKKDNSNLIEVYKYDTFLYTCNKITEFYVDVTSDYYFNNPANLNLFNNTRYLYFALYKSNNSNIGMYIYDKIEETLITLSALSNVNATNAHNFKMSSANNSFFYMYLTGTSTTTSHLRIYKDGSITPYHNQNITNWNVKVVILDNILYMGSYVDKTNNVQIFDINNKQIIAQATIRYCQAVYLSSSNKIIYQNNTSQGIYILDKETNEFTFISRPGFIDPKNNYSMISHYNNNYYSFGLYKDKNVNSSDCICLNIYFVDTSLYIGSIYNPLYITT